MNSSNQNMPIICNMNVFTPVERDNHIQNTNKLFRSVQTIQVVENGYEFFFPTIAGSDLLASMAEFISNERLCCPFLKFTLTINTNPQPVSLILTGPEGTPEFLREEFSEA